ncbi:hypothetical protein HPB52_007371 [Rhipicephalus sanguineus]|uniref:Tick transposon n=1 Tax=Rhipicephalus sanguineus TaxID=34632 RepID=A0A9D4PDG9_RHISA|nr:hypothetical protein HPB52_007371 [Rhipicephalus sanguineus]
MQGNATGLALGLLEELEHARPSFVFHLALQTLANKVAVLELKTTVKKEMLRYDSAHSKLIKRRIAVNDLRVALPKSCDHLGQNLERQLDRLERAGFPKELKSSVTEVLLKEARNEGRARCRSSSRPNARPVALPCIHRFSHRQKKVAAKCGVPVAFSVPEKLARISRW